MAAAAAADSDVRDDLRRQPELAVIQVRGELRHEIPSHKPERERESMSLVADSTLFDTAVHQLFHLPETLERVVLPSPARPHNGGHHRAGGGGGGAQGGEERGFGSIPVDILETPKEYTFFFDVPGIPKSDIQVTLEEDKILVIKSNGKRKREEGEEVEGCRYLRLERRAAPKFLRKLRLPDDANPAAVTAKCDSGVLTVVVEKLPPPESKTKKVEVTVT